MSTQMPPPGWHPDPAGGQRQRYWDGSQWTQHYADSAGRPVAVPQPPVVPAYAPTQMYAPVAAGLPAMYPQMPKSKTTAVLLAVFLSFWMWIYTYKVDAWKFWMNLGLTVLTLGLWGIFVSWPWSIIDAARRSDAWYLQFPNGDALQAQYAAQSQGVGLAGLPAPTQPPSIP